MATGDIVAVVGLGVVGLILLQTAKASGAMKVVGVTSSPGKGELATALGADAMIVSGKDVASAASEATRGRGFDIVFDCAGTASTLYTSTSIVRPQGRIVVVGMADELLPLSVEHLFTKELTVTGVRSTGNAWEENEVNRWNRSSNWEVAQHLVLSGTIRSAPLVTHTFAGSAIGEAYRLLGASGAERLQVVLEWNDLDVGLRS
jgi:threonine dehydrogenase-like Zn-dependent dehydrogenase